MTVLRVLDFETTGMEPPAEVVEVGLCDLTQMPDGSWGVGEPDSWLCLVAAIPPEVRAVHHITMGDVVGSRPFDRSMVFAGNPTPAAIVAHNYEFEQRFLGDHGLPTICTYKAALRVARGYVLRGKAVPLQPADLKTVDDALCLASESPSA